MDNKIVSFGYTRVNVFYDSFEVTRISEVAKVTPDMLFGSIGGIMGLMTGISVMSVVEIFELISWLIYIIIIHHAMHRKSKKNKIKPVPLPKAKKVSII